MFSMTESRYIWTHPSGTGSCFLLVLSWCGCMPFNIRPTLLTDNTRLCTVDLGGNPAALCAVITPE